MKLFAKRSELEPGCPIPGCAYCQERVCPWPVALALSACMVAATAFFFCLTL
jgi:hypothetical protein